MAKKSTGSSTTGVIGASNFANAASSAMTNNPIQNSFTPQQERALTDTSLMQGKDIADMYGITYDRGAIEDILNTSTNAAYKQRFTEQGTAEDTYYQQLSDTAATQYAQARQDRGAAIMSGASAGARAANELANMLGVSQNSQAGLTELAQQRKLISDAKAAAIASNGEKALNSANEMGATLGSLAASFQSNAVSQYAADSDYNAQVAANNANGQIAADQNWASVYNNLLSGMATSDAAWIASDADKYAADKNLSGVKYNADKNLDGTKYAANANASATKQAANASAAAQRYAADASAAATRQAANASVQAAAQTGVPNTASASKGNVSKADANKVDSTLNELSYPKYMAAITSVEYLGVLEGTTSAAQFLKDCKAGKLTPIKGSAAANTQKPFPTQYAVSGVPKASVQEELQRINPSTRQVNPILPR